MWRGEEAAGGITHMTWRSFRLFQLLLQLLSACVICVRGVLGVASVAPSPRFSSALCAAKLYLSANPPEYLEHS